MPRLPRLLRLPSFPHLGLGLACGLLVLVPALLGAELTTRLYEQRLLQDVRGRTLGGLDALSAQVDQERTRTLNNAEVAAERLGPLVQTSTPDALLTAVADTRSNALRSTSLVAVIDAAGRTLASDPASNLQFGNQGDVKTALQGKLAAGWQERTPLALEATAPLRADGPLPGAVVVAENVDDGFLNTGLRLTGLDMALVQNGRIVAASRNARRSLSFATDLNADPALVGPSGDTFARSSFGPDAYFVATRAITVGGGRIIGTLLVALPAEPTETAVQQLRGLVYAAAALAALGAAALGTLLGQRIRHRLARVSAAVGALGRGEPSRLDGLPTSGAWGQARQALIAANDQVERRLDEARGRAEHLHAVLASLNEGVIVADAQRRVMLVNPAARGLLNLPAGASADEAPLGLFSDELVPPSERVIRSYSAPVRDEAGEVLGTVTVLRDATRDQELDRLKSKFLAVVSHELQTPLTSIKGALELVLDDDTGSLSRVQRRFLDTIDRNSARLVGLVGDLLDLSRLEAGRLELDPQPLDTPGLVRGALAAVSNLFEARATQVRVDVPDDVPPIYGDRRRVEQILTNLLTNAAKYTPAGGAVDVTAWSENGHVALSVADNGPGVPASERDIIFDKFYRGRDAQRRGEAGSGLGLAIVKSLVELHGGQVRIEDSAPRGARFVVELPRASDED